MSGKSIVRVAAIVGLILLIPVFGNLYVEGWNWGPGDFIFGFVTLLLTGLAIDFSARRIARPLCRGGAIAAVLTVFLVFWVEAATGGVSRTIRALF